MGSEQELLKACLEYLRVRSFFAERINSGKIIADYGGKKRMIHLCTPGTPDIIACIPVNGVGVFVGIELKKDSKEILAWEKQWENYNRGANITDANKRSVLQHQAHERIRNAGGEVIVCCSLNELEKDISDLQSSYGSENK